jgi:hypothetical protein
VVAIKGGFIMVDDLDDTSSNPQADLHLPATGEFDASNIQSNSSALVSADAEEDDSVDPNDINQISAKNTDQTQTPSNPAGPADPADIGNSGSAGIATADPGNPNSQ